VFTDRKCVTLTSVNKGAGVPRNWGKLETLTKAISGRIRPDQEFWLKFQADKRFEGEMSRTLRWALDEAQAFRWILEQGDPVRELDEMLHPEKYEFPDREEEIAAAERELEEWKREQAVKRSRRKSTT
jgi:hypothetical protein